MIEKGIGQENKQLSKEERAALTAVHPMLAPCSLEDAEDGLLLQFDDEGLKPFDRIRKERWTERYRLLVNCAELETLTERCAFSLAPENLVYDQNLIPRVLVRSTPSEEPTFAQQYCALIANVLYPRRSFDEYMENGEELYAKRRKLSKLAEMDTAELKEYLMLCYKKERFLNRNKRKTVRRKRMLTTRIVIPLLAVGVVTIGTLWWLAARKDVPYRDTLLQADNAYIAGKYIEVTDTLRSLSMDQLPLESRYILANSAVSVESISDERKQTILNSLTLRTEENIIDYWAYIGRGEYLSALEVARNIGDRELVDYAQRKVDGPRPSDEFLDTQEHWAADAIDFVVNEGLFTGSSNTMFSPDAPMNRAMLATVLWRLAGQPESTAVAGFADVTEGSYFADAVAWAAEQGVVSGISETAFNPEGIVTRQQLAVMLFRYADAVPVSQTVLLAYEDAESVAPYAMEGMAWAVRNGIVTGATATTLSPSGNASRAQVAVMLQRFAALLEPVAEQETAE